MTDFGSDFSGVTDLDPRLTVLSGDSLQPGPNSLTALAQALARRYAVPPGGLPYDPAYGRDLRLYIGSSVPIARAIAEIEAEAKKDQRVNGCTATIDVTGSGNAELWQINIAVQPKSGPTFTLTLLASRVTVDLLTTGTT